MQESFCDCTQTHHNVLQIMRRIKYISGNTQGWGTPFAYKSHMPVQ